VLSNKKRWESFDHLLLNCKVAKDLWSSPFNLFGIEWAMPRRVREWLMSWGGQVRHRDILEVWSLALLSLIWRI
jgi:hypothetical protein